MAHGVTWSSREGPVKILEDLSTATGDPQPFGGQELSSMSLKLS